jgi:hypothetical protein
MSEPMPDDVHLGTEVDPDFIWPDEPTDESHPSDEPEGNDA